MPTMKTVIEDIEFVLKNSSSKEANKLLEHVNSIVNRQVYCVIKCDHYIDIGQSIFCADAAKAVQIAKEKFGIDCNKDDFLSGETIYHNGANYYFCTTTSMKDSGWIPYIETNNVGVFVSPDGNTPLIFDNRDDAEEMACHQRDKLMKDCHKDVRFMIYPVKIAG